MGSGISRIDPATNSVVAHVGEATPCGAPVVALGSIWQAACDSNVFLRIDPNRNIVTDTIPAQGHVFLVLAGDRLITVGSQGLARLDPDRRTFTAIPNPAAVGAEILQSDGTSVWVKNPNGFARIDPTTGRTIAGLSDPDARAMGFADDHAWMSVAKVGVREIDLATTKVRRTIPVLPFPLMPVEAGDALWVTDFETSDLWRVEP
jgi:streptogramin lyase